jgi:hypothetical protein
MGVGADQAHGPDSAKIFAPLFLKSGRLLAFTLPARQAGMPN